MEEAILKADPVAPSRAALSEAAAAARSTSAKKLSSVFRGDLDTISAKALKKSPTERYATANAFGEDIARFLRGDVVLAQPDSVAYRALKFARRHWVGIAATGVLLLTLAGGLAATSYEARVASVERDAARQAQSRLLTEAAAQHLKAADVAAAQGITLEVLRNPEFTQMRTPAAISVFQEIRAADANFAVLSGHGGRVICAAYSPDGTRIVTASLDKTARIWDATIPATLDDQITWEAAAQADALSDVDRTRLGLPADSRSRAPTIGSACDQAAAAFYDPDRLASGSPQSDINADIANPACAMESAQPRHSVRLAYQWGRALWAKHDLSGARRQFEFAVSKGYRAAGIDLGNLLTDGTAGMLDPQRAVSLYEIAWRDGLPIAGFVLGHLYEFGVPSVQVKFQTDVAKAWVWYQKGADAGEPTALARFGKREESNAFVEKEPSKAHALLLRAFRFYAAAAERARDEDWPDEAWRDWRYRRATLARLLAREGMMRQVADAYSEVCERRLLHASALWEGIKAKIPW